MDEILDVLQDVNMLVTAVVIGVIVAVILEVAKIALKNKITDAQIKLGALLLGWLGGMIAMYLAGGDFASYSIVGLGGGVYAPSIYEFIIKKLGFNNKLDG